MVEQSVEFVARGAARSVSRAIEEFAQAQGHVSAIVVPWEGSAATVSMSVTAARADGWAIEHTNLGTITLTDRGDGTTAVTICADEPDRSSASDQADRDRLAAIFDRFAGQLPHQFKASHAT